MSIMIVEFPARRVTFMATSVSRPLFVIAFSLGLLAVGLCGNAWADNTIGTWRSEAALTRILAENDVPAAYKAARRLESTLPSDATPADRARLLNLLSRIETYLGETEKAAAHAREAFDLAKKHGDRVGQAEADLNVTLFAVNQGKIAEMSAAAAHSMTILDGVDRPELLSEAMLRMAMMHRRMDRVDESVSMAVQTLEIAKRSQNDMALTYAYQGMAVSYELSGRYQESRNYYESMLNSARAAHSRLMEAEALLGMGVADSHLKDISAGDHLINQGIALYRAVGVPFYTGRAQYIRADNLRTQGKITEAISILDAVAETYASHSNKIGLWWTLDARSKNYLALGRIDLAQADAEHAYRLAKEIDFPIYIAGSARRLAEIADKLGDHKRAYKLSTEATEVSAKIAQEKAAVQMGELARHYEEKSRQQQVEALKQRNEKQTAELHQRELERRWLSTAAGSSLILLVATVFFLIRQRRSHRLLEAAHSELQHSKGNLQAILDAIPDMLFELGLDGRYYDCRSLQPDLLAAPVEQLIGKTIPEILPPDASETCLAALHEAHEAGISTGRQFALPLQQGVCWFELSVAKKPVGQGESPRFIALARDITVRKQLENDARVREQYQQALLDNFPFMVWLKDTESRLLAVNRPYLEAAGLPADAAYFGKTDLDLFPAELAEQYRADDREVMRSGQRKIVEEMVGLPGNLRLHETGKTPVWDDAGNLLGTVGFARDITAHKAAEAALLDRERQFRTLTEHIPDGVARYDSACRYVYFNPQLHKVIGKPEENILGKTPVELRDNAYIRRYQDKIEEVLRTGREADMMHILPYQYGIRKVHDHIRFVPERDATGQVVSVLAIGRDVSAIKEAERQLRSLVDNLPDFVVRLDTQARHLYVSPAVTKAFGVTEDHFLGKTVPEVGVTGDLASDQELMRAALRCAREGVPTMLELTFRTPAGDRIFDIMHVPERDEFGYVTTILAVARDITSLRNANLELSRKEALLRSLIDSIPDLIFFKNTDSVYLGFNKAFSEYCGLTEEQLVGKTDYAFASMEMADFFRRKDREMLSSGTIVYNDEWATFPNGKEVLLDTMKAPLVDANGEVIGVIGVSRDITEHRRMEQELVRREREFRTLAESAPDNIVRYDRDTRMRYVNPVLERSIGLTTEEVMGKRTDELFPQNEAMMEYQAILQQVIATGIPAEYEMVSQPVGGDRALHDLIRIAPELDGAGRVVGAIAIGRDYTEQKRLEQELIRREQEFRTLAENSPNRIVRYDCDCRRLYVNRSYNERLAVTPSEVLGKTPLEYWSMLTPSADEYTHRLQQVIETGRSDELHAEGADGDSGATYHVAMTLVPEFDTEGRVNSVLSISHDISGIKRMEAMLRKSELEFRTLAENSPNMIVRYDHDCRRVFINPAYERYTGIPLVQALNKTPEDIWKPLMPREEYRARLQHVMATGQADSILLEWYMDDGTLSSHQMVAVAEYDEQGMATGVLVIGHDISEFKATERRLEESRANLQVMTAQREVAREEERKRIAREIHDELGQLLNVLRLNVTTLDYRFGDANPDLRARSGNMVATVDRAISMVRNLATRLRPAVLSSGICAALEWMVQEFESSTGIECRLHLPDNEISLDEDRAMVIFRIVQESLTNVLRHSGASRVEITLERHDDCYEVEVRDNGRGLNPEKPVRANSFGIVGMRERALMLGGELDIKSNKEGGVVLTLHIPVAEMGNQFQ